MSRATFTCDSCSAEVGLNDAKCPSCGKIFDAVRCPRCGHQGPPRKFGDGCPRCGYLARPAEPKKSVFVPAMAVLLVLFLLAATVAWVLRSP